MIQAATAKVIDFSESDPRNSMWLDKVRLLCDRLELENFRHYNEILRTTSLASMSRSDLTDDSYEKLRGYASEYTGKIRSVLFPWVKAENEDAKKDAYQGLYNMWVNVFGDPDDPAVQAEIERTAKMMLGDGKARTR